MKHTLIRRTVKAPSWKYYVAKVFVAKPKAIKSTHLWTVVYKLYSSMFRFLRHTELVNKVNRLIWTNFWYTKTKFISWTSSIRSIYDSLIFSALFMYAWIHWFASCRSKWNKSFTFHHLTAFQVTSTETTHARTHKHTWKRSRKLIHVITLPSIRYTIHEGC